MTTRSFDAGAAAYERCMGRWSRLYVPALLARAGINAGQSVLDVATGTGEAAVAAARLVGPSGRVLGVDISLPMLQGARAGAAASVRLAAMDAQALAFGERRFDAAVCQLGLMFVPDLERALREIHRVLRPNGRFAACVWSTPARVPFTGVLADALSRQLPAERASLYAGYCLGDPSALARSLREAGFREVTVSAETRGIVFESFDDYWDPIESGGGRMGQIYRGLPEDARRAVRDEVRQLLSPFESGGRITIDAEALFASGRT